jgi:hypothetical protein
MKIWATSALKELWYYNDYIGEEDPSPSVSVAPNEIPLQYENTYMDAFAFVMSSRGSSASLPKNISLSTIDITNLFYSDTLLSVSVYTDYFKVFTRIVSDLKVTKNDKIQIDAELQCYDYIIIRVETSEGFHTK